MVPRSVSLLVLCAEVKKASFRLGRHGPERDRDGAAGAASGAGTEMVAPPDPPPAPAPLAQQLPRQGWRRNSHPIPRGESSPPQHHYYSREYARRKRIRLRLALGKFTKPREGRHRIAPLCPFTANDLNSPHPGPTGSYLATANTASTLAGSSPGGTRALPRRVSRAQGRTI